MSDKASSAEPNGSNGSDSPGPMADSKKRGTAIAGLDNAGNPRPVKRRAAKACAACRARKVRCDVMQRYHRTAEGDVVCSNCTMDGIKCVIEESKRRKKHLAITQADATHPPTQELSSQRIKSWDNSVVNPTDTVNRDTRRWSGSPVASRDFGDDIRFPSSQHTPHPIYQSVSQQMSNAEAIPRNLEELHSPSEIDPSYALLASASMYGDRTRTRLISPTINAEPVLKSTLPDYIKPLPPRMTLVEIDFLYAKGALSLPDVPVRNALLRSYVEYVHPFMPLIELNDFLQSVNDPTGNSGQISLLLFQAIMFAGTGFVDMEYLRSVGFMTRKSARKAFFQRARVLYDFDYEVDRVSLVQSLLLMTYWYETPDDQKDTWHWMGVAISLAHTIGLHRNPGKSNMEPSKKKLWKRIWWSCFMRDRLIALGMRRPTRIKDEDYDVPMLAEDDFDIRILPVTNSVISQDCTLVRDLSAQRTMAQLCIAKAKLCLCISHVLSAQYSVLVKHQGMQYQEGSTRSSVMLFPKKIDQTDEVKRCDVELNDWINELPASCIYSSEMAANQSGPPLFVQQALLHMIFFTTLSALHRPQVLPSAPAAQPEKSFQLQDLSRKKVREASREITKIAQDLHVRGLEKYLPTTGVTVLLPAIIIHLLDIKASNEETRIIAQEGFCQCMAVLEKLRDSFASADFATQFLEAAVRKANIDVVVMPNQERRNQLVQAANLSSTKEMRERSIASRTPPSSNDALSSMSYINSSMGAIPSGQQSRTYNSISALTPPENEPIDKFELETKAASLDPLPQTHTESNLDLNDFLNFDNGTDMWNVPLEEGAHGESGGFMEMTWIDQVPSWSRLNSVQPEIIDQDGNGQDLFEIERIVDMGIVA